MLGIIYMLANTLGLTISGGFAAKENYDAIKKGKQLQKEGKNIAGIYSDRNGATRSLATHKLVSLDYLPGVEAKGKDCYMRDMYGHPIRNISEEQRNQRLANAMANRDSRITVVKWKTGVDWRITGYDGAPFYSGAEYKDLSNGDIYVARRLTIPKEINDGNFKVCSYFMNVKNGLLVRETDIVKESRRNGIWQGLSEEASKKFIEYFNKKQSTEGYFNSSAKPDVAFLEADGTESEIFKHSRLGSFFCNKYNDYNATLKK